MRLPDRGRRASSQGSVARPEATAWPVAALDQYGLVEEANDGFAVLSAIFDEEGQN